MTDNELKPIIGRLADLCALYESTFQLMSEHSPEGLILDHLNTQFRDVLDQLDQVGVMP